MSGTTVRRSPRRQGTPQAEPKSKLSQTVAEVLNQHVVLETESIDRMYLDVIVGRLQILEGALHFIRQQRKATNAVEPMTRAFVQAIEQFVKDHQLPLITFEKRQRKDEVAAEMREVAATRGRGLRWQGAKKVHRLSHRETTQSEEEHQLRLDRQIHRPGQ
jgi:hypothetical protein